MYIGFQRAASNWEGTNKKQRAICVPFGQDLMSDLPLLGIKNRVHYVNLHKIYRSLSVQVSSYLSCSLPFDSLFAPCYTNIQIPRQALNNPVYFLYNPYVRPRMSLTRAAQSTTIAFWTPLDLQCLCRDYMGVLHGVYIRIGSYRGIGIM